MASTTSAEDLRELFETSGEVQSVSLVFDVVTRQHGGFAHVVMADEAEAFKCIEQLNGRVVNGRVMHVEPVRKRIVHNHPARVGGKAGAVSSVLERR